MDMMEEFDWDAHFKAKLRETIAFAIGLGVGLMFAVFMVMS